jgi:citrate synthase
MSTWIDAAEAARMLDVSRATLYAYVSRGFVRSRATAGASRERKYSRDDVERLRRRTEERRDPDKAAARALQWGMPILESAITLIDGGRLFYRGHDAVTLSRTRSIAGVASLIWSGSFDAPFATAATTAAPSGLAPHPALSPASGRGNSNQPLSLRERGRGEGYKRATASAPMAAAPFATRAQAALAAASARDSAAFDLQPAGIMRTGWRILNLLTHVTAETTVTSAAAAEPRGERAQAQRAQTSSAAAAATIDATLAQAWGVKARGVDLIRAALILCADHELNVSSFTARCVASAGSHPYAVVIAGLAALEGTKHGGASARVEAMLTSMRRTRDPRGALVARLRRGETIDGFGHPLYPDGDPRATALIGSMRERYPRSAELAFIMDFADAASTAMREEPNLDFALAAVSRLLRLPAGSALTLFATGRTIGWIGHAIEQYATGQLIRPRARYAGVPPLSP